MEKIVKEIKHKIASLLSAERKRTSTYRVCKNSGLQINQLNLIQNQKGYRIDSAIRVIEALGYDIILKKKEK